MVCSFTVLDEITCRSARVFSSGLSASVALINLVKTGDHIIAANNIYGGKRAPPTRIKNI